MMSNYDNKNNEEKNRKAFEAAQAEASAGNLVGLNRLGMYYLRGIGCEPNQEMAFKYVMQAENGGFASALYNLGGFYADGIGCRQDKHMSFHCFY